MPFIDCNRLRSLVSYDPEGYLIWLKRNGDSSESKRFNSRYAGKRAHGEVDRYGYRVVQIDKTRVKYHRAIFAYHYGFWPETVDHINRNPLDNRIENLRAATRAQQQWNTCRKPPKSGAKGVIRKNDRWYAVMKTNGKRRYLGAFSSLEEAAKVYAEATSMCEWYLTP